MLGRRFTARDFFGLCLGLAFVGGGLVKIGVFVADNPSELWLFGGVSAVVGGAAIVAWTRWSSRRALRKALDRQRSRAGRTPGASTPDRRADDAEERDP